MCELAFKQLRRVVVGVCELLVCALTSVTSGFRFLEVKSLTNLPTSCVTVCHAPKWVFFLWLPIIPRGHFIILIFLNIIYSVC
jgi:hypothetical protein